MRHTAAAEEEEVVVVAVVAEVVVEGEGECVPVEAAAVDRCISVLAVVVPAPRIPETSPVAISANILEVGRKVIPSTRAIQTWATVPI